MSEIFIYKDFPPLAVDPQTPDFKSSLWYAFAEADGNIESFTTDELEHFRQKFTPAITAQSLQKQLGTLQDPQFQNNVYSWIIQTLEKTVNSAQYSVFKPFLAPSDSQNTIDSTNCFNIQLLLHWYSCLDLSTQMQIQPTLQMLLPATLANADHDKAFVLATLYIILICTKLKLPEHTRADQDLSLTPFINHTLSDIEQNKIDVQLTNSVNAGDYEPATNILFLNLKHSQMSPLVVIHELYHRFQDSLAEPKSLYLAEYEAHVAGGAINLILQSDGLPQIEFPMIADTLMPLDYKSLWDQRLQTNKPLQNLAAGILLQDSRDSPTPDEITFAAIHCKISLKETYKMQSFAAATQTVAQMDKLKRSVELKKLSVAQNLYKDPVKLAAYIQKTNHDTAFANALLFHALKLASFAHVLTRERYKRRVLDPFLQNFDFEVVPSGFDGVAS